MKWESNTLVFIELTGLKDKKRRGGGHGKMRAGERLRTHLLSVALGELQREAQVSWALILTLPVNMLGSQPLLASYQALPEKELVPG